MLSYLELIFITDLFSGNFPTAGSQVSIMGKGSGMVIFSSEATL